MSEAVMVIESIRAPDIDDSTEALKAAAGMIEDDDPDMIAEGRNLLDALTYQLEVVSPRLEDFSDVIQLRRIKHLMRCVHIAFNKAAIVEKFTLEPVERCFAGIRVYYALLEVHSETAGPKDITSPTDELRDYISMVLSAIITSPPRELVYTMLFHSLVDLCQDMTPPRDKRVASEIGVVLQCTYKRVRSVDADLRGQRISAGVLLAIIEDLLQIIPPVQWRRRPKYGLPHGDLPLRVVKTLLQRVIGEFLYAVSIHTDAQQFTRRKSTLASTTCCRTSLVQRPT
jgi:cytoskeleton-associated protein 5